MSVCDGAVIHVADCGYRKMKNLYFQAFLFLKRTETLNIYVNYPDFYNFKLFK